MTVGRTRTTASALLVSLLLAIAGLVSIHNAPSAHATPSDPNDQVAAAKKKVDALYAQAEEASERYNSARIRLTQSQARLRALQTDIGAQQKVVDGMRDKVAALVVSQYQGNPLSAASQVVFSSDSNAFIDNLSAASSYNDQQAAVVKEYQVQLKRLQLRKKAADDQVAALTKVRSVLSDTKAQIDKKAAAAKAEFDDLSMKAQMAMLAGVKIGDLSSFDFSGPGGTALKYALAQVGKPYVWGASGPSSFDCSGLTMAAWSQAGVSLPHSSSAQMSSGRPVAESDLQPGDLVFYYSPVHHVGMYIGNGLIVNAENPSVGVKITGLHSMPYSGAVRPG